MTSTSSKFDDVDRYAVKKFVEQHYDVVLTPVARSRSYFRDKRDVRYLIKGGYGLWHGIDPKVFDAESHENDNKLIIARRYVDRIDVYAGSLGKLCERRGELKRNRAGQYHFDAFEKASALRVVQCPGYTLHFIGTMPFPPSQREDAATKREAVKAIRELGISEDDLAELMKQK